jgi:hypothetical protein
MLKLGELKQGVAMELNFKKCRQVKREPHSAVPITTFQLESQK